MRCKIKSGCLFTMLFLLLVGCKKNIVTDDNQIEADLSSTAKGRTENVQVDSTVTYIPTISPTLSPVTPMNNLPYEQNQQKEFDLLCQQYSDMLASADDIGRIDDFLYCVDAMNSHQRKMMESQSWKEERVLQANSEITEQEMEKLANGEFIKLPTEGAVIDFDFDGTKEEFVFYYDPDVTKHQEYIISIDHREETGTAQELYGELYACSLDTELGKQVYIVVVENGPHGDDRGSYLWTYWESKPCYIGYVSAPPEEITIESYEEKNVLTYEKYVLILDTYCKYTAHDYIGYKEEDFGKKPGLYELDQVNYELSQPCRLIKDIKMYSKKSKSSELITLAKDSILSLVGVSFEEGWLSFKVNDENKDSFSVYAKFNGYKDEVFIDSQWISLSDVLCFIRQ